MKTVKPGKKKRVDEKSVTPLRKRAEALAMKKFGREKTAPVTAEEAQRLIHELQTHQIELEIQNEELRNAQLALEDAKRKYSDLYDFAPLGYFTFDRVGIILEVNLAGAAMLGVDRGNMIGNPFALFIGRSRSQEENYQAIFSGHVRRVLKTGERQICGIEIARKDGSSFFAALESVPSTVDTVRTAMSDITERRKAELALKESEEKYRSIFEGATDGILACDLQSGRFLVANKRFTEMTGYSENELLKMGVKDLHREEDLPYVLEIFGKMASGKVRETNGVPVLRKDGSIIHCDIGSSVFRKTIIFGFFRDVTKRRQTEEKLRERTAQLELSNRELESFAFTVSHDLRAPLRSIDGFGKILLEDHAGSLNDEAKDYLNRLLAASHKMEQLIEDLLALSRIVQQDMDIAGVNLSGIASDVTFLLRESNPGRKVEFIVGKNLTGKGDYRLLRTALEKLIDNAWKFTSKTDHARIEFGAFTGGAGIDEPGNVMGKKTEQGKTVYYVRDNGAGFDMAYAKKLFLPFQRLHSEKEFSGRGIGLAVAARIIRRHGGVIWAEGRKSGGATFYFTLEQNKG